MLLIPIFNTMNFAYKDVQRYKIYFVIENIYFDIIFLPILHPKIYG